MKLAYFAVDPVAASLLWYEPLPEAAAAALEAILDTWPGLEAVRMYRYGARIDMAAHVTTTRELGAALQDALELRWVPLFGDIEFTVLEDADWPYADDDDDP